MLAPWKSGHQLDRRRPRPVSWAYGVEIEHSAGGKGPGVLHILARIAFRKGDREKAIVLEGKAIHCAEGDGRQVIMKALASYREGKAGLCSDQFMR